MNKTLLLALVLFLAAPASAEILPGQIAVLANSKNKDSVEIAGHYLAARGVPKENLVLLSLPGEETISREAYEREMIAPIRKALEERKLSGKIRVLVSIYGVPLRIAAPEADNNEKQLVLDAIAKQKLARIGLGKLLEAAQLVAKPTPDKSTPPAPAADDQTLVKQLEEAMTQAGQRISNLSDPKQQAEEGQKLTAIITRFGGFDALTKNLKPRDGEHAAEANAQLEKMKAEIDSAKQMLTALSQTPSPENRQRMYGLIERIFGIVGVLNSVNIEIAQKKYEEADASVDSELSLLWWERDMYSLPGRLPNPLFYRVLAALHQLPVKLPLMMVSRIDAPQPAQALAMIDNAIQTEKTGLKGTVYVDARGLKFNRKDDMSHWDQNLRDFGWAVRRETNYTVRIDDNHELLEKADDCAIYAGWYQLRKYADVFTFVPGAIGFHIASEEAVSIHNPQETGWCKNMLAHGITATLGAIGEPYLDSFPLPREFFGLLMSGRYSLVEAYYLTSRYISWRMVLFGDPLYNPWRGKGTFALEEIGLKDDKDEDLKEFPQGPGQLTFDEPSAILKQVAASREQRRQKLDTFFNKVQAQIEAQKAAKKKQSPEKPNKK